MSVHFRKRTIFIQLFHSFLDSAVACPAFWLGNLLQPIFKLIKCV